MAASNCVTLQGVNIAWGILLALGNDCPADDFSREPNPVRAVIAECRSSGIHFAIEDTSLGRQRQIVWLDRLIVETQRHRDRFDVAEIWDLEETLALSLGMVDRLEIALDELQAGLSPNSADFWYWESRRAELRRRNHLRQPDRASRSLAVASMIRAAQGLARLRCTTNRQFLRDNLLWQEEFYHWYTLAQFLRSGDCSAQEAWLCLIAAEECLSLISQNGLPFSGERSTPPSGRPVSEIALAIDVLTIRLALGLNSSGTALAARCAALTQRQPSVCAEVSGGLQALVERDESSYPAVKCFIDTFFAAGGTGTTVLSLKLLLADLDYHLGNVHRSAELYSVVAAGCEEFLATNPVVAPASASFTGRVRPGRQPVDHRDLLAASLVQLNSIALRTGDFGEVSRLSHRAEQLRQSPRITTAELAPDRVLVTKQFMLSDSALNTLVDVARFAATVLTLALGGLLLMRSTPARRSRLHPRTPHSSAA